MNDGNSITLHLPDSLRTQLGFESLEAMETDLRLTLAARLFEEGRLSLGRAAELAGMHKADFMDELGRRKIPVMNWDDEEIRHEFADA